MSQAPDASEARSLRQWVLGLAVAIFCCAIVFHFVARFIADTQERVAVTQYRLDYLQARLDRLESATSVRLAAPVPAPAAPPPAPVAIPAPAAPPPLQSLPSLIVPPPIKAPEVQAEKTPVPTRPYESKPGKKPVDKIIIVSPSDLMLNTRTNVPDASAPAAEGKASDKSGPAEKAGNTETKTPEE